MPRARRSTAAAIDYGRAQEFSDEDVFEDVDERDPPTPAPSTTTKRRGRPRKGEVASAEYQGNTVHSDDFYQPDSKIRYFEKGYDMNQPHIRDRFTYMPELELDGSPKVELIVGRRLIDRGGDTEDGSGSEEEQVSSEVESKREQKKPEEKKHHAEYEYLIKYRGVSYLHLEWKSASDLESMNKSAKNLYRRYLKKLQTSQDDELESPDCDPLFILPQRIIDQDEHEIIVEISDEELVAWEKEQQKEKLEMSDDEDEEKEKEKLKMTPLATMNATDTKMEKDPTTTDIPDEEIGEPGTLKKEEIEKILRKEGSYYPEVAGSDNPYRDGYITEPPKKPRASYLFFQGVYRSIYQKRNKGASVGQVMSLLGETWRNLTEEQQAPFIELANEEVVKYEKQKILLEKAQRPNGLWQPIRRCNMVLERLKTDTFAEIFLEAVDLDDFPDYMEYVDSPMDLAQVRKKLNTKKYQGPENFARDMRKIWNNCKIYNQHGSAIWYVADYMSKQFERLYAAWVIAFRDRYLRWVNPAARPWETSCRVGDGKCNSPDSKMVLCDHCEAHYAMGCLKPRLREVPTGVWHCNDCAKKIKKDPSARLLSSVAENAARKRAELGDIPTKKIVQTKYLVKWAGLGYEHCGWERKEDINDDALIAAFHKENNMILDDLDVPEKEVDMVLHDFMHLNSGNAGGSHDVPLLRSRLYSQTRGFQFAKFGMELPEKLCVECGPATGESTTKDIKTIFSTQPPKMPALLVGEYDTIIPVTVHGLLMNVGEVGGSVAFLGYRSFPDGSKGPAEEQKLIREAGDKIISVDGVSTVNKTFQDVIQLLKNSGSRSHAHMRFLSKKYSNCKGDVSSMGVIGRYSIETVKQSFRKDRRHLLIRRQMDLENGDEAIEDENGEESDGSAGNDDSEDESDEASILSFDQVSDDEDLVRNTSSNLVTKALGDNPNQANNGSTPVKNIIDLQPPLPSESEVENDIVEVVTIHQETTRSLALRLLDVDLGYSSDEGGHEECAYFIDGVDHTFAMSVEEDKAAPINDKELSPKAVVTLPAKKNEFEALGQRGKICASVVLSSRKPDIEDFDNYPLPCSQQLEALKEAESAKVLVEDAEVEKAPVKFSETKIEQLASSSNEVMRVWISAEDAAATLQISLIDLKELLSGRYSEDVGDEVGGYSWRYAPEDAEVSKVIKENDKGKKAFLEFRDKLYEHEKPFNYKNGNRLRDYQVDGVNWLASCWYKSHSCILADEMGLGKTVQIVCYIEHLQRVEKVQRPFLVVVPLSTVEHWRREFEGWSNLKTCVYHDRQRVWRDVMREYEWYYADRPHTPDFLKFDVLVTTYDTLIGDFDILGQIPWRVTVVDEAHRLRNQKGKLLECMKEISAKGTLEHGYQSRVLMTGTPLQNNIQELWTLLNFIEPYQFPSLDEFEAHYGNMGSREQVESLQNKISPFMLRRVKEDVAKDIPAKEETLIDVELTSIQKQYYRAIFEHNHSFLNMGTTRNTAPKLMNIQMELRKCCNHPFLLDGIEQRETEKQHVELLQSGALDNKSPEEVQQILNEQAYIATSGKMVLLDKLLPKLRVEGHKVLIFSQMVKMLDFLSEYCDFRNFKYERLDGRVRGNERQKAIDRFETEEDSFIFMLSTRAGGVGINLTAADTCIIFDSDWNPQNDVQAQARCHRIGQTKQVRIYRLITSRSFETEMFDRASKKLGLEQAVLGTFDSNDDDGKPTAKEMEQLLKKGAYALLGDDNDEITQSFCADDIESILAKRTRTRVVEGTKTANWLNKKGLVTKSKFTADSTSAALDMDDPNFWEKVMPDFVTPSIMAGKLEELEMQVTGTGPKKKRGRKKKVVAGDESNQDIEKAELIVEVDPGSDLVKHDEEDEGSNPENGNVNKEEGDGKFQISRTYQKKINKFIEDLRSMLDGIFDDMEDDSLQDGEKTVCENLLLTISVKEKLFNEAQRLLARNMLKRLEGDRRRRCRDGTTRFSTRSSEPGTPEVNEKLMIRSTKKRRKKRLKPGDEIESGRKRGRDLDFDKDIVVEQSGSEGEWSGGEDDMYGDEKKMARISKKESRRRRAWAMDKDAAKAAGNVWPSIPRNKVSAVLGTLLDKVVKYDKDASGGLFSQPVPKDEFPEYYEMIKKPMDYSKMKNKVVRGGYRSAHALQKDFVLVMRNCMQFNASDSDIVKEARKQALLVPSFLRDAAMEHYLFLSEDGAVIEVYSDDEGAVQTGDGDVVKKRRGRKPGPKPKETKKLTRCLECGPCVRDDCGQCEACKDKKKFGGSGTLKQSCAHRNCENLKEVISKAKRRGRPPKKALKADEDNGVSKNTEDTFPAGSNGSGGIEGDDGHGLDRIPKKRKMEDDDQSNSSDSDVETNVVKRPREDERDNMYLDVMTPMNEREALDGSFASAKMNFIKKGVWTLPLQLKDHFAEVVRATITIIRKNDTYLLFQDPVTEDSAPDYFEVVKEPMDFGTMMTKVEEGRYGNSDIGRVYEDFLLVLDNCALYNDGNDEVTNEAARLLGILPETYAKACVGILKQKSVD